MRVITLKRFEFSAARRLDPEDRRWQGINFILWVGVTGPVAPATGMVINVTELKAIVSDVLDGYDHRHLNKQLGRIAPTTVNVAKALWADITPRLPGPAALASVELIEEGGAAARVSEQETSSVVYGQFSAAHRTHAPQLSDAENIARYGKCDNPAGHGHNYRAELKLPPGASVGDDWWAEFDHKNLSVDIPALRGRNIVTEAVAELIARRVPPARSVRVWETPDFFAEYRRGESPAYRLGRRYRFGAAHRLHSPLLTEEENLRLFGKCSRPEPHGHTYTVEVALANDLDLRTEAAYDLGYLDKLAGEALVEMDGAYIDRDVPAFRRAPSTGENIARHLWSRFAAQLGSLLDAVRLWETPNNQFVVQHDEH